MQQIAAYQIYALLDFPSLVEALRAMFRDGCEVPPRHHHTIATEGTPATLLLMPAWQQGSALGVKIVTVFPDNGARRRPSVYGTYLLLDPLTGEPRAMLDGRELTLRRTAAASALAAGYLARPDSRVHLIVGTGALAKPMAYAYREIHRTQTLIWGRNGAKAAMLQMELRQEGFDARGLTKLEEAVGMADIITCVTLARDPLIRGEWLKPGTHLDLVGGFTPEMREADDAAVARATVYVDTDQATKEAGDIVQPLHSGALTHIAGDLFGLCRGEYPGRRDAAEITLFKSVGTALEDLAAARLAVARFVPPKKSPRSS